MSELFFPHSVSVREGRNSFCSGETEGTGAEQFLFGRDGGNRGGIVPVREGRRGTEAEQFLFGRDGEGQEQNSFCSGGTEIGRGGTVPVREGRSLAGAEQFLFSGSGWSPYISNKNSQHNIMNLITLYIFICIVLL